MDTKQGSREDFNLNPHRTPEEKVQGEVQREEKRTNRSEAEQATGRATGDLERAGEIQGSGTDERDVGPRSSESRSLESNSQSAPLPPVAPSSGAVVGGGVGALGGGATGAAIGTAVAGPVGTLVGAVIGAIAGTAAGMALGGAVDPDAENQFWRKNSRIEPYGGERPFEELEPGYRTGFEEDDQSELGTRFKDAEPTFKDEYIKRCEQEAGRPRKEAIGRKEDHTKAGRC